MERAKRFFQRHRRGLAVTAAVAGAGYLAYTYLRDKVKEVTEATSTERNDQEKYPNLLELLTCEVYVEDLFRINRIVCLVFLHCIRIWHNRY